MPPVINRPASDTRTAVSAPRSSGVTSECMGALTAFLVSDAGRLITGGIHFVDAGYNIVG